MNVRDKSASKKNEKRKEWKPNGKVFNSVGYKWKPIRRTFTLVGNVCPLTMITTTNKVPLRVHIPLEVVAPEHVVTKVYTRRPKVPKSVPNSKPMVVKSMTANRMEPATSRGSDTLVAPSSSSLIDCSLVRGLPRLKFKKDHLCSACAMGKSKKQSHKPKSEDTNQEKLYLLRMDLCGPMRVKSINGKSISSLLWMITLGSHRLNAAVRNIHTDNGTKFVNQTLRNYHEQAEVVATACYTQSRSIIRRHCGKTPYELLHDRKSDLSYLHVFGALCYPNNDSENLGKLQAKAYIGISSDMLQIRKLTVFTIDIPKKIIETIHVDFDELAAMASKQSSLELALHEMTRAAPTSVASPVHVEEAPAPFETTGSPSLTTVDQDAPSPTCGYRLEEGIDFEESFASVARLEAVRIFLADVLSCEKLVSWSSKKQDCTALSTAEAEYVSLSACCAQVLWMRTQSTDYGFHFDKILIYCDSKSAIAISCNPVQHSRTKHIAVRFHFIKEHMEKCTIELYFVKTNYQLADIFTKALPTDRFNYLVRHLGMRSLSPKDLERLEKSL
nr:retrovirus-related Pol polyprotein from transposon TNT 1-94 [Tanacetum cinerariifolium]